jgi:BolA-like protein 3
VEIRDVSGGCGDFFQVLVVSPKFAGVPMVRQHRLVNEVLEKEIGNMHGLTLKTMDPAKWAASSTAAKATS